MEELVAQQCEMIAGLQRSIAKATGEAQEQKEAWDELYAEGVKWGNDRDAIVHAMSDVLIEMGLPSRLGTLAVLPPAMARLVKLVEDAG